MRIEHLGFVHVNLNIPPVSGSACPNGPYNLGLGLLESWFQPLVESGIASMQSTREHPGSRSIVGFSVRTCPVLCQSGPATPE
jgi:hypothetical protein